MERAAMNFAVQLALENGDATPRPMADGFFPGDHNVRKNVRGAES